MYFMEAAGTVGLVGSMLPFLLVLVVMYFLIISPQKKKDKQMQDMRSSVEIGDSITTIGGIVGIVVSIKEDTLVVETGTDRSKIRFKRWAISEVNKLSAE